MELLTNSSSREFVEDVYFILSYDICYSQVIIMDVCILILLVVLMDFSCSTLSYFNKIGRVTMLFLLKLPIICIQRH